MARKAVATDLDTAEPWQPLRVERLFEKVANLLREGIASGRLQPGRKLPNEQELARQFKVGRSVVREALKVLELQGLLEVRRGYNGGTFVRLPPPEEAPYELHMAEPPFRAGVAEVLAARLLLEPAIAASAAHRAAPADRRSLARLIDAEKASLQHPATFINVAADFDRTLAHAAGNPVLEAILDGLRPLIRRDLNTVFQLAGGPNRVIREHRLVADAVAKGDQGGAGSAMRAHLQSLQRVLRQDRRSRRSS